MSTEPTPRRQVTAGAGRVTRSTPPQRLIDAINPVVRWLVGSPMHSLVDHSTVVLHVLGRRSGRGYDIPVGFVRVGDQLVVTTQHRWRANLRGVPYVDVTMGGRRRRLEVTLAEQPEAVANILAQIIETAGWHAARRRLGLSTTDGGPPTTEQLRQTAVAYRLAVLTLAAPAGSPPL